MSLLKLSKSSKRGKTRSHAHAPKQEGKTAKRLGGRTTKASGALDEKGDVRVPGVVRIECKCTKNKSFSVTQDMVRKIEEAALGSGEIPAIEVQFIDEHGKVISSVAVMPVSGLDMIVNYATTAQDT